jgi:hypothetical protein
MDGWVDGWGARGKPSTGARGNAARVGTALPGSADPPGGGGGRSEGHRRRTASPAHHTPPPKAPPSPPSAPRFPSRLARSTTAFPSRAPQPKHDLSVHRCILPRGCCSPSPALRSHAYLRNSSFFPLSFELLSSPNGLKHLPNYPSCHPAAAPGRRRPVQARYCAS